MENNFQLYWRLFRCGKYSYIHYTVRCTSYIYTFCIFMEIFFDTNFSTIMTSFHTLNIVESSQNATHVVIPRSSKLQNTYSEKSTQGQPKHTGEASCTCRPVAMKTATLRNIARYSKQWYWCENCSPILVCIHMRGVETRLPVDIGILSAG